MYLYLSCLGDVARFERKRDGKRRALVALAHDFHLAFVSFHNSVKHRQSKAYALALGFGREKWIENLRKIFWRDAFARILNKAPQYFPAG